MTHIMPRITGARSGRTVLAGMSTAVSWTFAGLVLACVFVATTGARESLGFRTGALQQAIAAGPATQNAVQADADWLQLDLAVSASEPGYGITHVTVPLTTDQITAAMTELASALAATPLPLAGRSADWSSLGTAFNPVTGAAPTANFGSPPQMEIMYRGALSRNSRLVSGTWPAADGASPASGASTPRVFQVVVTRATAQRFGLRPGSRLEIVNGRGLLSGITLVVTGIVQPAVPHSAFWTLNGVAAKPSLKLSLQGEPLWWLGAAFAGPGEVRDLQRTFSVQGMHLTWEFPLALGGVDADHTQELDDHLNRAVSESASGTGGRAGVPLRTVVLTSGLVYTLDDFLGTQAQVEAMLALLFTGLTVLGAVMLLLGARLLAESRSAELALMRARGASLWQLAALTLRGSAAIVLPAAAAGAAAAVASTPDAAAPLAWWLAVATVLVAIVGPPLVVARRHHTVNLAADPAARRRAQALRWVAEAAVVTAAAGGLILLHQDGWPGGSNAYLSAAPVLVAAPAALVILRLYPLVLRCRRSPDSPHLRSLILPS